MKRTTPQTDILRTVHALYDDPKVFCDTYWLVYCDDDKYSTWIKRSDKKENESFTYTDSWWKTVSKTFAIYADWLWIAPAWSEVYINPEKNAHHVAVAVDGSGNKQYLYNEVRRTQRDLLKSYKLLEFVPWVSRVRKWYTSTLRKNKVTSREHTLAVMLWLEDHWAIRIWSWVNEPESSDGLTSLKPDQFHATDTTFWVTYTAKGSKERTVRFKDHSKLTHIVERSMEEYAHSNTTYLFESDGSPISPQVFSHHLQTVAQEPLTPKEFRTWHGSVAAFSAIAHNDTPTIKEITTQASEELWNTPVVAKRSYIHPHLLESYREWKFDALFEATRGKRCKAYVSRDEMDFYELLPELYNQYMK